MTAVQWADSSSVARASASSVHTEVLRVVFGTINMEQNQTENTSVPTVTRLPTTHGKQAQQSLFPRTPLP